VLRDDRPLMTCLFQGFDGTLLIDGPHELFWHRVPFDEKTIQVLPRALRHNPGSLTTSQRFFRALWLTGYLGLRPRYWRVLRDKIVRRSTNTPPPSRDF
jgi:hypothetical protein